MAILQIDENSKQAKAIIAMLKTFSFVKEIKEKPRYNKETEKVIKEVLAGKGLFKAKSTKDLMEQLNS